MQGEKQNVLSGTSAAAMCLKKALMNGGEGEEWLGLERAPWLCFLPSLLIARRTHLITTQEGHWEMWCACPHSWWLPLIGAPMVIFLSFDPLLRIPPSTGKQNPNHLIYVATNSREIYPGKATKWTVLSSPFQGCALMPTDTWAIDWTLLSWWLARVCILWLRKQEAQQGMLKYYIPRTRAIRTDSALMGEVLSSLLKTFNQYTVVQHTDVSTSVKAF